MNLTWQRGRNEMDKQTAIDLLDNLLGMVEDNHESDYDTAIKMGIDALQYNAPNALSALDCVERQATIDAVLFGITYAKAINKSTGEVTELFQESNKELTKAADRIKELPSVQPQRMRGKWIRGEDQMVENIINGNYMFICSNCSHSDIHAKTVEVPYCWYCGADMRGGQDDR